MCMMDAFICAIVGIDEPGGETWWDRFNSKTVVLRRDIATLRSCQQAGLILTSVSKLELICIAASGKGQQLMTKADAHGWNLTLHGDPNGLDRLLHHLWIARTVRDEDRIEVKVAGGGEQSIIPGYGDD